MNYRKALSFVSIGFALAALVLSILDWRNPGMGFLNGQPFRTYLYLLCFCAAAEALALLLPPRQPGEKRRGKQRRGQCSGAPALSGRDSDGDNPTEM